MWMHLSNHVAQDLTFHVCAQCGKYFQRKRTPRPGEPTFCSAKCRAQNFRSKQGSDVHPAYKTREEREQDLAKWQKAGKKTASSARKSKATAARKKL